MASLRHIQRIRTATGWRLYLRAPGRPRVRLPDLPETDPAFLRAYLAALADAPATPAPRAPQDTIAATVELYRRSSDFAGLSATYRRTLARHLDAIVTRGGKALARDLAPRHVAADLRGLAPHAGRERLKAWRALCRWAAGAGLIPADPARSVPPPRAPQTDGHPPWTADEVARFRARWPMGTVERLAFEVLAWTGARVSDAVRLGPPMVGRDGVLAFRQVKTGDMAYVPWSGPLPAWARPLEAERALALAAVAARPSGHLTWLATTRGTRSAAGLGNLIGEAATAAGVPKSAHGLRKARAAALADLGATTHQIAAWTGHQTLSEVARYTAAADRRRAVTGTAEDVVAQLERTKT
jgi:integrase